MSAIRIPPSTDRPVQMRAGVTLGVGLGGFVDGIVLHQIAQWHNMGWVIAASWT